MIVSLHSSVYTLLKVDKIGAGNMAKYEKLIGVGMSAALMLGPVACSNDGDSESIPATTSLSLPEQFTTTTISELDGQFDTSDEEIQRDINALNNADVSFEVRCDIPEERGSVFDIQQNQNTLVEHAGASWSTGFYIETSDAEITISPVLNTNPEMFELSDEIPELLSDPSTSSTFNISEIADRSKTFIMAVPNPDYFETGVGEPIYMTVMRFFEDDGIKVEALCLSEEEMGIVENGLLAQPNTALFPSLRLFIETNERETA